MLNAGATFLMLLLGDPCFGTRQQAQRSLADLGLLAVPALLAGRELEDPEIRWRVAELLRPFEPEPLPPPNEPPCP